MHAERFLAAAGIRPGSTAVPTRAQRGPVLLGPPANPLLAAWTFDDRAGYIGAHSDASAVCDSGGAPRIAFIGHVRENSHGFEVARLSVFDNVLKTLLVFVRTWEN